MKHRASRNLLLQDSRGRGHRALQGLVVQGFTHQFGLDYTDIWAPTGSLAAYRLLLIHVAIHDYNVRLLDIKCALTETIYASPPMGMDDGHFWRLRKAFHRRKQAARSWHACLREALYKFGYSSCAVDPALILRDSAAGHVAISTHVDDTAATGPPGEIDKDFAAILAQFEGRLLGEINGQIFLGNLHSRDRKARTITMSQPALISSFLKRHGYGSPESVRKVSTPMDPKQSLDYEFTRVDSPEGLDQYAAIVGGLLYLAWATRPDLAHSASVLSCFMAAPTPEHLDAARRVCRYLAGAADYQLVLGGFSPDRAVLSAYSDSDFANCTDTFRSVSGMYFGVSPVH
jgi:hypothetical protein